MPEDHMPCPLELSRRRRDVVPPWLRPMPADERREQLAAFARQVEDAIHGPAPSSSAVALGEPPEPAIFVDGASVAELPIDQEAEWKNAVGAALASIQRALPRDLRHVTRLARAVAALKEAEADFERAQRWIEERIDVFMRANGSAGADDARDAIVSLGDASAACSKVVREVTS